MISDNYTGRCRYELVLSAEHIFFTTIFTVLIPLTIMTPLYIRMAMLAKHQVGTTQF